MLGDSNLGILTPQIRLVD